MLSLADAIIKNDLNSVTQQLRYGEDLNQLDEYGFTPLIEAAIANHLEMSRLLLSQGAYSNLPDITGGTALHWAAENNNLTLCRLLLKYRADPNAYTLAGQPVLVMPTLRRQSPLRKLLIQAGANEAFSQDFIHTKLLGHLYELIGTATIVDPKNQLVEVDFEGFYLEVTLGLIAESLSQFQNHFAARQLRRYSNITQLIVQVIDRAARLIQFQQYQLDETQHDTEISQLIAHDPLLIPVGYEGHAITFIRHGDIWVKCDRREDSRLYDNIMFYRMRHPEQFTPTLVKHLIYQKQTSEFINETLDKLLGLEPLTELKVSAQISGNCSWANVEAAIPALFFLILTQQQPDKKAPSYYKTLALNFFQHWREWNKQRALHYCIQQYQKGDVIRKACKAELLAAILFQFSDAFKASDRQQHHKILSLLVGSPYEYILKNYVKIYYFEQHTDRGKRFYHLMKEQGIIP